jgi:adenylate cyclase
VQLIDVGTGYHRWSQRFDRTLDDVFAIQDEIAQSVAASVRGGVLSRRERQALVRPQTDAVAYEYYLRGRQHLPRLTQPDLEKSSEMFGHAIELEPQYGGYRCAVWAAAGFINPFFARNASIAVHARST